MADINDMELDEELGEEQENYITLTDDDGNDVSFEILGTTEYKDRLFAILLPFDEDGDEVVILEMLPTENDDEFDFVSVDDDSLLGDVFEVFKKEYSGDYDFQ